MVTLSVTIVGHGANVNARDAAAAPPFTLLLDMIDALIKAGADVELKKNRGCTSLLAHSAYRSSCESALTLLQHEAKVVTFETRVEIRRCTELAWGIVKECKRRGGSTVAMGSR